MFTINQKAKVISGSFIGSIVTIAAIYVRVFGHNVPKQSIPEILAHKCTFISTDGEAFSSKELSFF